MRAAMLALITLAFVLAMPASGRAAAAADRHIGEAIYRQGLLASGEPVQARRAGDVAIQGGAAACVNCHQRSGLGSVEGRRVIPPISGRYLFRTRSGASDDDLPYVEGIRNGRQPYTEALLARAIREGIDAGGRPLDYLMPRFAIDDKDMAALIDYLKGLDPPRVAGVSDTELHFATVVTPDADPARAAAMIEVMEQFFVDKNRAPIGVTPKLRSSRKFMFLVNRRWQLHVWRLTGAPAAWPAQLARHMAEEPVLAIVSGVGGTTWAPIQAFCEAEAVPCLFPNIESPPADADRDFYSLYFSKGVLLEAELIADAIRNPDAGERGALEVRQVYRTGDSGEPAARALAAALARRGVKVRSSALGAADPPAAVAKAVAKSARAGTLVLWLHAADLAALGDASAAPDTVFISGLMGGLERAPLPPGWRDKVRLAYPVDLPDRRRVRVDYARGWFAMRHIPVVDEQLQADTYLACGLLAETVSHMADSFVRDYLIERLQDVLEHRILTGYYPRLALATGQRYASKGGYIVRFADPEGNRLAALGAWSAP